MTESKIEEQIEVQIGEQTDKIYKITNGFCLIINIINFDGKENLRRDGSEENVKLIKEAFEYHGFQVDDYSDLNYDEIIELINKKVDHENCRSFDAFVLYIHTHGILDHILCKNSFEKSENGEYIITKAIHFHEIIALFKNENCENLKNKPKLLFFDCCRSGELNYI